jgi:penicillin amidase
MQHGEARGEAELSYSVAGLEGPAEILVDLWGIPHIYAGSSRDAFFVQGFNAARDRLWQMDLWRRRGLGQISEVFGPPYVERDRAARLFLYRGDMEREWAAYAEDTEEIVAAFVEGVNEYVELTRRKPELLPLEFEVMGYEPALWAPEDVVRIRSHGMFKNLASEVQRALVLRDFGSEVEALRKRLDPPWEITLPHGLDLDLIPTDVLRVYELATSGFELDEERVPRARRESEGSNNWVISPQRTTTGRPILANDPHRDQSLPSLRYIAHLVAPGMDVIGAGEPILPGISIGHNGKVAFGLTIFSMDQEDLYVYQTNPDDPDEYRYEGRWEAMDVETQRVPVRDQDPVSVSLKHTRHGPVIYEDLDRRVAFAVRAAWLEPGMAPYLGSTAYMRARNWEEFSQAMNRWGAPGENQVYADAAGNIGWKPAGLIPIRPNWDGLLPVHGDGRYERHGFLPGKLLPDEFDPPRGWIATANEMNLPKDFVHAEYKVGFEWYDPFRAQRIAEVLSQDSGRLGVRDSVELQTDYLSVPARRLVPWLGRLRSADPRVSKALDMLLSWDCVLSASSATAALFEVWYRLHLRERLLRRIVPQEAIPALATEHGMGDAREIIEIVEEEGKGMLSAESLDEVLLRSLSEAIEHLEQLLGSDMECWEWGRLHHAAFSHPLSPVADEVRRAALDIKSAPRGGSVDTVGNTAYDLDTFRQTGGSSWRMVVDVGEWDNSVAMNSPGQSGDPRSPHYADLFPRWANDEAIPLLYSRQRVEEAVRLRIALAPQDGKQTRRGTG